MYIIAFKLVVQTIKRIHIRNNNDLKLVEAVVLVRCVVACLGVARVTVLTTLFILDFTLVHACVIAEGHTY
jgi:hypothetical protein